MLHARLDDGVLRMNVDRLNTQRIGNVTERSLAHPAQQQVVLQTSSIESNSALMRDITQRLGDQETGYRVVAVNPPLEEFLGQ